MADVELWKRKNLRTNSTHQVIFCILHLFSCIYFFKNDEGLVNLVKYFNRDARPNPTVKIII